MNTEVTLGLTSIERTVWHGDGKCVEILVAAGAGVNNRDLEGVTALIVAVQ